MSHPLNLQVPVESLKPGDVVWTYVYLDSPYVRARSFSDPFEAAVHMFRSAADTVVGMRFLRSGLGPRSGVVACAVLDLRPNPRGNLAALVQPLWSTLQEVSHVTLPPVT